MSAPPNTTQPANPTQNDTNNALAVPPATQPMDQQPMMPPGMMQQQQPLMAPPGMMMQQQPFMMQSPGMPAPGMMQQPWPGMNGQQPTTMPPANYNQFDNPLGSAPATQPMVQQPMMAPPGMMQQQWPMQPPMYGQQPMMTDPSVDTSELDANGNTRTGSMTCYRFGSITLTIIAFIWFVFNFFGVIFLWIINARIGNIFLSLMIVFVSLAVYGFGLFALFRKKDWKLGLLIYGGLNAIDSLIHIAVTILGNKDYLWTLAVIIPYALALVGLTLAFAFGIPNPKPQLPAPVYY